MVVSKDKKEFAFYFLSLESERKTVNSSNGHQSGSEKDLWDVFLIILIELKFPVSKKGVLFNSVTLDALCKWYTSELGHLKRKLNWI